MSSIDDKMDPEPDHPTIKSGSVTSLLFFSDPPHTLESTDSVLYVRYYTNSNSPNNGFKGRVKIGEGSRKKSVSVPATKDLTPPPSSLVAGPLKLLKLFIMVCASLTHSLMNS